MKCRAEGKRRDVQIDAVRLKMLDRAVQSSHIVVEAAHVFQRFSQFRDGNLVLLAEVVAGVSKVGQRCGEVAIQDRCVEDGRVAFLNRFDEIVEVELVASAFEFLNDVSFFVIRFCF